METKGTVVTVTKQWWFKVNTQPMRSHPLDGAVFPHVIKVQYTVNGTVYTKRKWIHAGCFVPSVGQKVTVVYDADKPKRASIKLL